MSIRRLFIPITSILVALPIVTSAVYFGGLASGPVIKCSNGDQAIRVTLPGFFDNYVIWGASSRFYLYGPLAPGKNTLGSADPSVCPQKNSAISGVKVNALPGAGTSGGGSTAEASPLPDTQCAEPKIAGFASNNLAEGMARDQLKQCSGGGISINKVGCPFGKGFGDVTGGCTNVGGLTCETRNTLCDLYKKCGAFTITGGSEGGHLGHKSGNQVDIRSTNADPKFESCLKSSGVKVLDEDTGTTPLSTGPHWHICSGPGC